MEEKEGAKAGEDGGKKGKKLVIIVVAALVVLLAVGGALAFLMLKGGGEEGGDAHAAKDGKKKAAAGHGDSLVVGPMFAVDNMIVNLMSEGGARYAKFSIAFELDAQELAPEMMNKKPIATDIIIAAISAKTAEELMTMKGKEALKNEIMEKMNERLKDGRIKNVYFTNFVVQ